MHTKALNAVRNGCIIELWMHISNPECIPCAYPPAAAADDPDFHPLELSEKLAKSYGPLLHAQGWSPESLQALVTEVLPAVLASKKAPDSLVMEVQHALAPLITTMTESIKTTAAAGAAAVVVEEEEKGPRVRAAGAAAAGDTAELPAAVAPSQGGIKDGRGGHNGLGVDGAALAAAAAEWRGATT